jgi:polysaccharide biosynthesis/export protein
MFACMKCPRTRRLTSIYGLMAMIVFAIWVWPQISTGTDNIDACCNKSIVTGVDSATCLPCGEATWSMRGPIPWETIAQGEYIGPHRFPHVDTYRLRVDDVVEFVYQLVRESDGTPYQLQVGDRIRFESTVDKELDRELEVQPDGTITVPLVGQVVAWRRTVDEIRLDLEKRYKKYYKVPAVTVTPIRVNTRLEDLRNSINGTFGNGGQVRQARVTPDGTVSLPGIGPVPAQGLSILELKQEIDARYRMMIRGLDVTPNLVQRAPRQIYVVGQVSKPGRYELTGPTTVIQALALAEGPRTGANLRQVVVFRRAVDWRLLATKVDVRGALYGVRPIPSDDIWLRDNDTIIVPKSPIQSAADVISLVATNGVYAAAPFLGNGVLFTNDSSIATGVVGN